MEHEYVLEIVLSALHVLTLLSSLLHTTTHEVDIIAIPILQMRTLRMMADRHKSGPEWSQTPGDHALRGPLPLNVGRI